MVNNIFKNGIFGGIIAAAVMSSMVFYMKTNPGMQPNAVIGFISMLLAFSFLILGVKQQREINNGTITFGKAFLTGLGISFIISTMYVLAWLVIFYNFFPGWNLCVRSDISRSSGARSFSPPGDPAGRNFFATTAV